MPDSSPMRVSRIASAVTLALAMAAPAAADTEALEQRIAALEQQLADSGAPLGTVAWSGVVEVEAGFAEDFQGNETSGFELATLELGAESAVNEWVTAGAVLLYEEGTPEDIEVDAATIAIAPPAGGWSATFGRTYVPFGGFETHLVSDTLALELGEAQETAAVVTLGGGAVSASAYAFNGDSNNGGEDEIEHYGARLAAEGGGEALAWTAALDYISSIADADGLGGGAVSNLATLDDYIAGYAVHGTLAVGPLTVLGEYLAAADAFEPGELAFDGDGAEPAAWQAELGYGFDWGGMPATAAIGVQGTQEAPGLGLPETRTQVGLSVEPWEGTSVAVEYASADDYSTSEGGSGESADSLVIQLAAEF